MFFLRLPHSFLFNKNFCKGFNFSGREGKREWYGFFYYLPTQIMPVLFQKLFFTLFKVKFFSHQHTIHSIQCINFKVVFTSSAMCHSHRLKLLLNGEREMRFQFCHHQYSIAYTSEGWFLCNASDGLHFNTIYKF